MLQVKLRARGRLVLFHIAAEYCPLLERPSTGKLVGD